MPPRSRTRRRCAPPLLLVVVGLLLAVGAGPAAAAPAPGPQRVVLVDVPGLLAAQIDPATTPTLWALAGRSGLGSLSVRSVRSSTCPVDGWLTVGAGRRAGASLDPTGACTDPAAAAGVLVQPSTDPAAPGSPARATGLSALQEWNDTLVYEAALGTLAAGVRAAGGCVAAVGPAAVVGAAAPDGSVDRYLPDLAGPAGAATGCAVTLVGIEPFRPEEARRARLARYDADVARVLATADGARVIVAGLSDLDRYPHLHAVLDTGAATADGTPTLLRSSSTRRPGLVQVTDVTTTLLAAAGADLPATTVGSVWQAGAPVTRARALAALADADLAAQRQRALVAPFFLILIGSQIGLYALAAAAIRKDWGRGRDRFLSVTRWSALTFAAAPGATFLANLYPWWRADHPLAAVIAAVALFDGAVVLLAAAGPWRRSPVGPVGVVAGITALVLGLDVATGSRLQETSLAGYTPLVAGRFYGFGNVAFALFATSALIAAGCVAHWLLPRVPRWLALGVPVGLGLLAAVVDGAPFWGSDVGGIISLVPGVFALGVLLSGRRFGLRPMLLAGGLSVTAVSLAGAFDYLRPPGSRTHLGRFVAEVLAGDAGATLRRKASANLDLLTSTPLTLLVPVAVLFLTLVLLRPALSRAPALALTFDRSPAFRAGLLATLLTVVVGFATNDSGIAIPSLAMTIAIPLAVAASVETVRQEDARTG